MIDAVWQYLVSIVTRPIAQLTLLDLGALLLAYGICAIAVSLLMSAIQRSRVE